MHAENLAKFARGGEAGLAPVSSRILPADRHKPDGARSRNLAREAVQQRLHGDDYYAEFLDAYGYACIGLHENPIEVAVSRANAAALPHVQGFTDERIRLLVAICREMQLLTGANPFFLPTRKLGEVLGVHWTEVGRWLRILEKPLQVIHLAPGEVRRRGGNRSPRYHYGPPQPAEGPMLAKPLALSDVSRMAAKEAA